MCLAMQPQSALLPHSGNQLQPLPPADLMQNMPGGQAPSPHSLQPPAAQVALIDAPEDAARVGRSEELVSESVSPSSDSVESSLDSVELVESAELVPEPLLEPPPQPSDTVPTSSRPARVRNGEVMSSCGNPSRARVVPVRQVALRRPINAGAENPGSSRVGAPAQACAARSRAAADPAGCIQRVPPD